MEIEKKQARTTDTRAKLMRAMEKLCARDGAEFVTLKAVIAEAGQKNESVLQYHFKNRAGLVSAIHIARMKQTQIKRQELVTKSFTTNPKPSVRDLCELMVQPTFLLCRSDSGYRQWIKAFGLKNASVRYPKLLQQKHNQDGISRRHNYHKFSSRRQTQKVKECQRLWSFPTPLGGIPANAN